MEPSENATTTPILQLGDPRLRRPSPAVADLGAREFRAAADRLLAALEAFRRLHGFGRAIAAPQIGVEQRLIAANLGDGAFVLVNPEVTWHAGETFTLWDDCMSFPSLLVRVRRAASISLRFLDVHGTLHQWERLDRAPSELFQHEIDHLDGILAIDRAIDRQAVITRAAYDAQPDFFRAQVDYTIEPTIQPGSQRGRAT
jgi:peptide deformylase